jgi:protein gp37
MIGKTISIAWTSHTFNPWRGCVKVGPGCDFCYAEAQANRYGHAVWGAGRPRRYFTDHHWNEPRKWNRDAERVRSTSFVFCASMSDVFDNEVEQEHRERLWGLIGETPMLPWQLVTKRSGNAPKMLPDWSDNSLPA